MAYSAAADNMPAPLPLRTRPPATDALAAMLLERLRYSRCRLQAILIATLSRQRCCGRFRLRHI